MDKNQQKRMDYLVSALNLATTKYQQGNPIISDKEWDELYFELNILERETGVTYVNSPTAIIHYEVKDILNKIEHNHPMLSLPKTKNPKEVEKFVKDTEYVAMAKMDGLTCSLCYENGILISAETRGDGKVGEDILHNAKIIPSIPKYIPYRQRLVIDGEIVCTTNVFDTYFSKEFSNARNFAAGSIRLLNSKECEERLLTFVAWDVIEGFEEEDNLGKLLLKLKNNLGFQITPFIISSTTSVEEKIEYVKNTAETRNYPIDGVVFKYGSRKLRNSLPQTAHHLGGAIAYKFFDEQYSTKLLDIIFDVSRNGEMTPVAVFEPVDDGDSIIEKASLHNISIMYDVLGETPYVGEPVIVIKSNQIIPQIVEADKSIPAEVKVISIPDKCPICGHSTEIKESDSGVKTLYCGNAACPRRLINRLDHFCSKGKGLDIKGLSKATLEKLIDWGWVNSLRDIYYLNEHQKEWEKKPGFGKKSVENILNAIENSREAKFEKFLCALGIPLIGEVQCKEIVKHMIDYADFRDRVDMNDFNWSHLEGFGEAKSLAIENFDYTEGDQVYKELHLVKVEEKIEAEEGKTLTGITVCITGKVSFYKNRAELTAEIEKHGGKVTGSISKSTGFLINNDAESSSSKNNSAKKLGVPIITEEEFIKKFF